APDSPVPAFRSASSWLPTAGARSSSCRWRAPTSACDRSTAGRTCRREPATASRGRARWSPGRRSRPCSTSSPPASARARRSSRRRMTYAELADESARIGRGLAAREVGKGTRVGLLMPNWPEWIATAFGVWRCGALLVPVNTLCRPRELAHVLRHADVALLIAVRRFLRHDYVAALEEIAPGVGPGSRQPALPSLRDVTWVDGPADGQRVD